MNRIRFAIVLLLLSIVSVKAQPSFDPVRMDEQTDERFFFPTISITGSNTLHCTWASANVDWIGAYGRQVDLTGNIVGETDTVDIQSTGLVSCPPRVEFQTLSTGAFAKMIYHE